jgi:hypothetical protein
VRIGRIAAVVRHSGGMSRIAALDRLRVLLALLLTALAVVAPVHGGLRERAQLEGAVSGCCIGPESACCPEPERAAVPRIVPTCCGVDVPLPQPETPPAPAVLAGADSQERCLARMLVDAQCSSLLEHAFGRVEPAPAAPPPASRGAPVSLLHRRAERGSRVALAQLSIALI